MNVKKTLNQQGIVRIPCGSNLYQLDLYDLSGSNLNSLKTLSTKLKTKKANKKGKELAKELNIPFFSSLKAAGTAEQIKFLAKLKKKKKQEKLWLWQNNQENNWQQWLSNYKSEEIAVAEAIQIMNRWIKKLGKIEISYKVDYHNDRLLKYKHYQRGIERIWVEVAYEIKNFWVSENQKFLIVGQKVRQESFGNQDKRWLYYHEFLIKNQKFDFYSYVKPIALKEELAQEKPAFSGSTLSTEETDKIQKKCGLSDPASFIEMLGWKLLKKKVW